MSWQQVDDQKSGSNGEYLSLKDGEKAVVVFLGEPSRHEVCWLGGKSVPPTAESVALGGKLGVRFSIRVGTHPDKTLKTFENSTSVFQDLSRLNQKYGLSKWAFEVSRIGSGTDTKYRVLPETQLSDAERAAYAALVTP